MAGMELTATLFCLFFFLPLVLSDRFLPDDDQTRKRSKKWNPEEEERRIQDRQQRSASGSHDNHECQEGNPLGVSYSGKKNITASGLTCQVWAALKPHEHNHTDLGEHNHCRNPSGDLEGVWCYTTDPAKKWEHCPVPKCASKSMMRVIDVSADNDQKADSSGEYTSATLYGGALPESFTICSAFMVEAWTTEQSAADLFSMRDDDGENWVYIYMVAASSSTTYTLDFGQIFAVKETETVFFPLQWTRVCISLDSIASTVSLVVDGQLLVEEEYRREEDEFRPANLSLLVGFYSDKLTAEREEYTGRVANLNVFASSTSVERMVGLTTAGADECGAAGDLLSWEEAEFSLHSQAKMVEVDRDWEGPCRREPKVQVFIADFKWHHDCMHHCKKIVGGRSPPVTTEEQWENLTVEVDLITQDSSNLSNMYYILLSATEGDKDMKLTRLDHWPEIEIVNNKTTKLEAVETIWRDFYTGERLDNWTKPWYDSKNEDLYYGENSNCMRAYTGKEVWNVSWFEFTCTSYDQSCPCSYPVHPILRLQLLSSNP